MNDDEIRNVFIDAGFKPPRVEWQKPDPKGSEYGFFKVCEGIDYTIILQKTDPNFSVEWECVFRNIHQFENWARDNS